MKRLYALLAVLLIVISFAACAEKEPERKEESLRTCVDIAIGKQGYYSTMSDVELKYYDGELIDIIVHDPTLLAFRVSENWEGGARIYSNAEIENIIEYLKTVEGTEEIIEMLEKGMLLTEAST